ncbi:SDR family NAD(P)-dependent oxidoreductase [Micromonospora sp. NPDC050200]|uniref:SDR family NAD(P)-dependent oxidoreductase n=1 Tax=Micromonospora sp. NPDC050200 TaxID=3155664 RepID=UPI0033CB2780
MTDQQAASPEFDRERYGPWAVVAGGSEGVGAAFADHLARAGVNLVLIARRPGPLAAAAAALRGRGVRVHTVEQDLTAPDALARIRSVTDELDVGLLIYNAGANTYRGEFVESDPVGVQRVIDLNVTAPLLLCRHFGRRLKLRRRGGILLVGSLAGYLGHADIGVYAAAKAFSRIFAEGLWLELQPYGVDVLELVLGVTRTPAMRRAGVRLDLPGVAEPDQVAAEGLASLAAGPVLVAGGNLPTALAGSGGERAQLVRTNALAARALLGEGSPVARDAAGEPGPASSGRSAVPPPRH